MTRSKLVAELYVHFQRMRDSWKQETFKQGAGSLVFFPEDYREAESFADVNWQFWELPQVLTYLKETSGKEIVPEPQATEFLTEIGNDEYVALVVSYMDTPERHDVQVHKINRAILN